MVWKLRVKLPLLGLLVFSSACVETYHDAAWRARYRSEYGEAAAPRRDHFIGSIYFATASSRVTAAAEADLVRMAARIQERRHAGSRVVLIGYSDRRRGIEENSELASERAQRVAMALERRGVELDRMVLDGRLLLPERTKTGERRVDIYLEQQASVGGGTIYPILVTFFLLTAFLMAVLIFRPRR